MELRFMPTTGGSNHHQVGTPSPTTASNQVHQQSSSVTGISATSQFPYHHSSHIQPLSQQQQAQQQSYHHSQTPTMLTKQQHNQQQSQQAQQQQNNNHHPHPFQVPLTPSLDQHRRTLERSARNLHYQASPGNTMDTATDSVPTRIPSLRKTRRISGSANNNSGGVGVPGSPRIQRSPLPNRAVVAAAAIKRNKLGSHTDNISSGSLNSIEV